MEPRTGDDRPHLPPPTLWPVGFAVGIACLFAGLIVGWVAAAIGAAITLVFGFLWLRDLATGGRAPAPAVPAGPEGPEQPTAAPVPAHVGEAAMPLPEPGERFPRSKFLEGATLGLGGVIGGIVTVPAVGLAVAPAFVGQGFEEIDVGPLSVYPEGKWVIATFLQDPEQGEVSRRTAYVRNNGLLRGRPSFTIVSNRCVHLGCPVQPGGLVQDKEARDEKAAKGGTVVRVIPIVGLSGFACPCHGGAYDKEGNRTAGPPVRALDRHEFSIRNGRLFIGKTYSVSEVEDEGANAKIKRYQLAGPGNHVDGWESWLYPLQPPN